MRKIIPIAMLMWVAASVPSQTLADVILIQSGVDTSPYSFVPSLPRYNSPTLYAFSDLSGGPTSHGFETFVRFDLPAGTVPEGQAIASASFVITYAFDFTGFGDTNQDPAEVWIHEITEAWDQTTLTWANRPSIGAAVDTVTGITAFGPLTFDITEVVNAWVDETRPNNGIALTSPTERVIGMNSWEAGVDPALTATLVLNTVPATVVPTLPPGLLPLLGIAMLTSTKRFLRGRPSAAPQEGQNDR
ncbi:DNRLRE domain-containing protein [Myxococcota bacterium]|nr:DNRLRE domain-containing protein [Myxococcota bacterium]